MKGLPLFIAAASCIVQNDVKKLNAKKEEPVDEMRETDEFVDMGAMGTKVGSLQLSMLNKSPIDSERPQDEEMVMI